MVHSFVSLMHTLSNSIRFVLLRYMLDGDGRISGNEATKFFALSNLSRSQLKQLWALSDTKRQGFLGFTEFLTAMQVSTFLTYVHQFMDFDSVSIMKILIRFNFIMNSWFLLHKQDMNLIQIY